MTSLVFFFIEINVQKIRPFRHYPGITIEEVGQKRFPKTNVFMQRGSVCWGSGGTVKGRRGAL